MTRTEALKALVEAGILFQASSDLFSLAEGVVHDIHNLIMRSNSTLTENGLTFIHEGYDSFAVHWVIKHEETGIFFMIEGDRDSWYDDRLFGDYDIHIVEPKEAMKTIYEPVGD